ncbi:MAG: DUF4062 domain-containing protein [Bacteroidales bacterium]|nr:DUF4062 domain-containing protein [Bacteroidales bacterium]
MSKINIFISSTCKDLHQDRLVLKNGIENLGHNVILSESFTFPIDPSKNTIDNCIDIVRNEADIFILIIKDNYGTIVPRTGRSVTHMELQTAQDKGIPIYTFTNSETLRQKVLLEGQLNEDSEFLKVCKFIDEVRQERSLWNFEYSGVDDILNTIKTQLSILMKHSLSARNKVDAIDKKWIFPHISPEAYRLLVYKEKNYVERFFFQVMKDEMERHVDLKLDYKYSHLLNAGYTQKSLREFARWINDIFDEIAFYLRSEIKLETAFFDSYKEDDSDFRQLYHVAKRFANRFADMLELGIHLKSEYVYPEYASIQSRISRIVENAISQLENLPQSALDAIEKICKDEIAANSEISANMEFPSIIDVSDKEMEELASEIKQIVEHIKARAKE